MKKDPHILNLSDSCRRVGISRNTIGRHVKSGKVSVVIGDDGKKGIQVSELNRVYGYPKHIPVGEPSDDSMDKGDYPKYGYPHDSPELHTKCEMVIRELKEQNRKLEDDKEYFKQLLRSSILRIEDKSGGSGKSKKKRKGKRKKK